MDNVKTTALNQFHKDNGAKMVTFAGYEMPVQYPMGVLKEHLHTRSKAGLFDVSHMGQIQVIGDNLAETLESVLPADLVNLEQDKQCYSFLLNADGGVIDDLMICRREYDFLLVVNAGCKDTDYSVLSKAIGDKVELKMLDDRALLALQGPGAAQVLTSCGADVDDMQFMQGKWLELGGGIEVWATRSGYTGEDGFELSVAADKAVQLAQQLSEHDQVALIGLGARDSLRLEAGLCLYGHELDAHTTPIEARLTWAIAKSRREGGDRAGGFPGAEIILDQISHGTDKQRIGLVANGKAPVREGSKLYDGNDQCIGEVCSGGFGPSLGKPVAMGYVECAVEIGNTVFAEVRKNKLPMTVSRMPVVPHRYFRG